MAASQTHFGRSVSSWYHSPEMAVLEALIANLQEEHRATEYTCDAWTALITMLVSLSAPQGISVCRLHSPLISAHNEARSFYVQPVKSLCNWDAIETKGIAVGIKSTQRGLIWESIDSKKQMDSATPFGSTVEKWDQNIPLTLFRGRVCAVVVLKYQGPAHTAAHS